MLKNLKTETDPKLVPTEEEWEKMSISERDQVENRIIAALEYESDLMGESTIHFEGRASAREVLKRFFSKGGRKVFIASDLHTLYPGAPAFYPDLMVVFDVEDHHRRSWNVLRERKGLDFVMEILSRNSKRKDKVDKMNLYACLNIPEYFFFDPDLMELKGFQLTNGIYREIHRQNFGVYSGVLGLFLSMEDRKIRFISPHGLEILFTDELIQNLNHKLTKKDALIKEYARLYEEEQAEKEQEKERAEKEKERAEKEKAEKEMERAEKEKERAEKERLWGLLKKHGIDD